MRDRRFAMMLALLALSAGFTECGEEELVDPAGRVIGPAGKPTGGDPIVSATDPTGASPDTTLVVRVLGSGYEAGSVAEFVLDGQAVPQVRTNSTTYVSSRELRANITIDVDAPTDFYDVLVTTPKGKRGIGIEKFEVFYSAIHLGSLGGSTFAYAVNRHGEVAGWGQYRKRFGPEHAFFWSAADGMEDLGPGNANDISDNSQVVGEIGSEATIWSRVGPGNWHVEQLPVPVGSQSIAKGISPGGTYVVGSTGTDSPWTNAVVWSRAGAEWSFSLLPVPGGFAQAADVNDDGLVAGSSDGQGYVWSWVSGAWTANPLQMPLNAPNGVFVRGINASGDVLGGTCCSETEVRPIVWRRMTGGWSPPQDVPAIPPGSIFESMNDAGWIAGAYIDPGGNWRAFLYRGAGLLDLGTPGGSVSLAWDVGSGGHVVGQSGTHSSAKAYLWSLPQ